MIIQGDAISLPLGDCSVDSIVCDPPAGIAFMNKSWDKDKGGRDNWIAWMQAVATEAMRVIRPGGHALVWAIPRTSHWTGMAWENAGWQPRDKVYHCFGSGFPKSLAVDKAIDAHLKVERKPIGPNKFSALNGKANLNCYGSATRPDQTIPATDEAKQWDGWGTALKPAIEEWWLFRKPLNGTVAQNVLKWGVGGLNIDGCRVGSDGENLSRPMSFGENHHDGWHRPWMDDPKTLEQARQRKKESEIRSNSMGRFPANLIHDGSDEVMALFPESNGQQGDISGIEKSESTKNAYGEGYRRMAVNSRNDTGSAARFFYCAKASKNDRDEGLNGMPDVLTMRYGEKAQGPLPQQTPAKPVLQKNGHPTVKPVSLMQYLCKLITPPNGIILDMFCGSGSTGKAAAREGFQFIGIEKEWEYCQIAKARCDHEAKKPNQMRLAA